MNPCDDLSETFTGIFDDIEAGFGVRIMFRDCSGIFRTSDDKPLVMGRPRHLHPYCLHGRFTEPGWDSNCIRDCRQRVESMPVGDGLPTVTECWKGVAEVVVPVMHGSLRTAIIQAGVFRPYGRNMEEGIPGTMRGMYGELEVLTNERAMSLARILHTLGQGMLARVLNPPDAQVSPSRQARIREYVVRKAHERIRLDDLASELGLSTYRAGHLVTELFGKPLQELIIEERLKRAKSLLASTDDSVYGVASRVGFESTGYFNRRFKASLGVTPGEYRRMECKKGELP